MLFYDEELLKMKTLVLLINPFTLRASKRGVTILEIFSLHKHFFENIGRRNVDQKINNNSP